MIELSNWGRWGKDDELGAINLITPERRRAAIGLMREGLTVSLARDVETKTAPDNQSPFVHRMNQATLPSNTGNSRSDNFAVSYHGFAHTHIDSLCHVAHEGRMYNGFALTEVTAEGARKLGVHNLKAGLLARAVLMDIPRLKGVDYLEPGAPIYVEDLEAWEKQAGVRVGAGDVILIRTGRWARRVAKGAWGGSYAGLHGSCAAWLKQRDVAIVGSDAASDVIPSGIDGITLPIHRLCVAAMGVWILDNCDLEAAASAAAERRRWEFALVFAPLAVMGGTGSPLNPLAVF